ncbi:MAG TPA: PilZ domain-containing protein [Bryobacteraceae bacterium]|nr:PilZ domain-containing protein [Bryobacteraceae bacterium]
MLDRYPERRKEARYPIEANVMVHKSSGETIPATAVNISSAGMLLHVGQPSQFSVDEEVTVEVELPDNRGQPLSSWGAAKIVHIDGCRFGIQLDAGTFDPENYRLPEVGISLP